MLPSSTKFMRFHRDNKIGKIINISDISDKPDNIFYHPHLANVEYKIPDSFDRKQYITSDIENCGRESVWQLSMLCPSSNYDAITIEAYLGRSMGGSHNITGWLPYIKYNYINNDILHSTVNPLETFAGKTRSDSKGNISSYKYVHLDITMLDKYLKENEGLSLNDKRQNMFELPTEIKPSDKEVELHRLGRYMAIPNSEEMNVSTLIPFPVYHLVWINYYPIYKGISGLKGSAIENFRLTEDQLSLVHSQWLFLNKYFYDKNKVTPSTTKSFDHEDENTEGIEFYDNDMPLRVQNVIRTNETDYTNKNNRSHPNYILNKIIEFVNRMFLDTSNMDEKYESTLKNIRLWLFWLNTDKALTEKYVNETLDVYYRKLRYSIVKMNDYNTYDTMSKNLNEDKYMKINSTTLLYNPYEFINGITKHINEINNIHNAKKRKRTSTDDSSSSKPPAKHIKLTTSTTMSNNVDGEGIKKTKRRRRQRQRRLRRHQHSCPIKSVKKKRRRLKSRKKCVVVKITKKKRRRLKSRRRPRQRSRSSPRC